MAFSLLIFLANHLVGKLIAVLIQKRSRVGIAHPTLTKREQYQDWEQILGVCFRWSQIVLDPLYHLDRRTMHL